MKTCKGCQTQFTQKVYNQEFHDMPCRDKFYNRKAARIPMGLTGEQRIIIDGLLLEFAAANLAKKVVNGVDLARV